MRGQPGAREIRASGPRGGPDAIRRAYLGLLKLALCDLTAPQTTAVEGRPGGAIVSRELSGEELSLRVEGRDWPLHGMTMIGLLRLDDLQACVESVVNDGIPGDLIEVGCWRGGAGILMRATLDCLGAEGRTVWLADSFQGFPAPVSDEGGGPDAPAYPQTLEPYMASFDYLAAPFDEVVEGFARFGCSDGVSFVKGFFEDTLPRLSGRRWSLARLDADTYDSTMLALACLYPGLSPGGYLVIDDYGALEECRAAVDEFRTRRQIDARLVAIDKDGVRWRKADGEPVGEEPVEAYVRARKRNEPMPRSPHRDVPTVRELELAAALEELRRSS
jgi:O-methyltransferase